MITQRQPKGAEGLLEITQESRLFSQPMPTRKRLSPHRWGLMGGGGGAILEGWRYAQGVGTTCTALPGHLCTMHPKKIVLDFGTGSLTVSDRLTRILLPLQTGLNLKEVHCGIL